MEVECMECGEPIRVTDDISEVEIAEGVSTIKVFQPHGLIHERCIKSWKEKNVANG